MEAGEVARRVHGQWLTVALSSEKDYPRIPVRPVETGGIEAMMERPGGKERAAQWWEAAFNRLDRQESLDDRLGDGARQNDGELA